MCATALYIAKTKIKLQHRLNNYKRKHRTFKKRNQKASHKLFHKHYCLDGHSVNDDCDFLLFERCEMHKHLFERKGYVLTTLT